MYDYLPISMEIPLGGFIQRVWMEKGETQTDFLLNLFAILLRSGCDYYGLMNLYSDHHFADEDIKLLANHSPAPKAILPISKENIRANIFRWSPSKYHTDCISQVIKDIYQRLLLRQPGMTIYNSNENPRRRYGANDRYILIITEDRNLFLDISRKTTIEFERE